MKAIFIYLIAVIFSVSLVGQTPSYDIASIPENLKTGADVIKRYEKIEFEVKDFDKTKLKVQRVLTILNEDGKKALSLYEYTTKYRTLDEAEVRLYDQFGIQSKKYKKKDFTRQGLRDGLVEDGYYNFIEIETSSYPITVEYVYEMTMTGTLKYPSYEIAAPGEAVQWSTLIVKCPIELGLRFKTQKTDLKPVKTEQEKVSIYTWEVKNLTALHAESGSVARRFSTPSVILAPNKFKFYSTFGDMSSWKSFGLWAYNLQNGLDEFPAERKSFFAELVKNADSEREKVTIVYDYLQKNFRYVSIQLGIGGCKPFPAKFTDEKKYGDCKGLSFYMSSVLKTLGIKSYTALINSGANSEPVDPSFPCNRFDHEILCVPQAKDTIWLECTSNTNEFNVLGSFTENRNALLLTENGGVLVATPKSRSASNSRSIRSDVILNEDGSGTIHAALFDKGEFREFDIMLADASRDDQKRLIVDWLKFKLPDDFEVQRSVDQTILRLNVEKISDFKAGMKMFLPARMHGYLLRTLPASTSRAMDYYFSYPYQLKDTTDLPSSGRLHLRSPAREKSDQV